MRIAPGRNDKSLAEGFRLARRRGASIDRGFVWGLTGVPTDRRLAAQVLHALWCELVEVAGRPDIVETRMASLAGWREEIARAFAQEPTVPLGAALAAIIETYELPYEEFMLLVDGIEMDAAEMMVAPERAHFDYYVRATAGALGVLLVAILGAHEPAARKIPMVLGEALAFTRMLRDLAVDAGRGRLYLPRDLLLVHGIREFEPALVLRHGGLPSICARLAGMAETRFARSRGLIATCDRQRLKLFAVALDVHHGTLLRLRQRGWDRPSVPVRLGKLERVRIALRHGMAAG